MLLVFTDNAVHYAALTISPLAASRSLASAAEPKSFLRRTALPRYLRVVRLIPLREMPPANSPYRRRLEEQLLDPAHTVTAVTLGDNKKPLFDSGNMDKGQKFSFTFKKPGTYQYLCAYHTFMKAKIVVTDPDAK